MGRKQTAHVLILMLAALIWGMAFVFQRIGADYVPAFTYGAIRSWIAFLFLIPVNAAAERIRRKRNMPSGAPRNKTQKKEYLIGGIICGAALFAATNTQQIGIGYTTAGKAGFITAMYVVMVPVASIFLGHIPEKKIWVCVMLGVVGMYFLCIAGKSGESGLGFGEWMLLLCAVLFCVQILCINHFVLYIEGIHLTMIQMLTTAVLSTAVALLFEHPTASGIRAALPSLLYAGIMSSGVAYTLQVIGEKDTDPTVACLAMCLESVFSAVGGWIILGETLTPIELLGCCMMFSAIVISQLPSGKVKAV